MAVKPFRVFVIAGEASGDKLGAALMAGMRHLGEQVSYEGVGGPLMEAEGLHSQFDMTELSVMGLVEVLPRYFALRARLKGLINKIILNPPDLLLTIDSPDFCLRVARAVKAVCPQIRTVHYVAPSVWAWRPKRAKKMAHYIDHVLALLPFEPELMQHAGMSCDFVGHPAAREAQASDQDIHRFRQKYDLEDAPLILALPGSRQSEVTRLMPVFGEALHDVLEHQPDAKVVLPVSSAVRDNVVGLASKWKFEPLLLETNLNGDCDKKAAFKAASVALAASGTVSLELAAVRTPMVIAYDMSWFSRLILKKIIKTDTVTLVNLISNRRDVPEYLGANCTASNLSQAVQSLFENPYFQDAAMNEAMQLLGQNLEGLDLRAAKSVQQQIKISASQRLT